MLNDSVNSCEFYQPHDKRLVGIWIIYLIFSIPAFIRLVASAVLVLVMFSVNVVLTKVETGRL